MTPEAAAPEIAVVVPSHDRPLRLRWLLNALEKQTLPRERWEAVVVHDSSGPETDELLRNHPLSENGLLRHVSLPPGSAPPGRNRNVGWQLCRAPVIAFTDDDCRPPPDWLERALEAATRHPGAVIQGTTRPDPEEEMINHHAPHKRTQFIQPLRPWAQACNIIYPRLVLEAAGGFPEDMYVGEDTALAERARAAGAPYVGAPEVETWHAVEEASLVEMIRGAWRWRDLPLLIRRHPRMRHEFPLYAFWKREHVWLPFAAAALLMERRSRLWALLAVPYLAHVSPKYPSYGPRGRLRALSEVPGSFLIDLAEFLSLAWGSIKHRKLFL